MKELNGIKIVADKGEDMKKPKYKVGDKVIQDYYGYACPVFEVVVVTIHKFKDKQEIWYSIKSGDISRNISENGILGLATRENIRESKIHSAKIRLSNIKHTISRLKKEIENSE